MPTIKDCFISRWGTEGRIMEVDFSQLEVIGAAHVTGDENLMRDLREGLDMHCVNASFMFSRPYNDIREGYLAEDSDSVKQRKLAKSKGFLIFYGGTAYGMSQGSELSESQCQTFIDNFFDKYPKVLEFQDSLYKSLESCQYPTGEFYFYNDDKNNKYKWKRHISYYESCTGRVYYWKQHLNEFKGKVNMRKPVKYSRPQVCNYPVQGFATGDIVPEMLGRVMRNLFKHKLYEYCLPVNTIHDSILFDVRLDKLPECVRIVRSTMKAVPLAMEKRFGLKLTLPFNVDVEIGESWENMEIYK